MKFILCFAFLLLFSGCNKVAELSPTSATQTEQTGDPVYDSETEVKVLVPWNIFL